MSRRPAGPLGDQSGQATVETAFGIAALCAVLPVALGGAGAVAAQLAAADLAGQVARAAARGEEELAAELPGRLDRRARAETTRAGGLVTARVTVQLPLLDVTAEAVALDETALGLPG